MLSIDKIEFCLINSSFNGSLPYIHTLNIFFSQIILLCS